MNTDHKLKTDVTAELAFEPSVNADHIGVTVEDGVVTLSGHVEHYWQKSAAERAAGRVQGVRAIAEEIEVRLPGHIRHGDDEIAAAALHRLAWNSSIPKDAIKVRVEKGFVTLTGSVEWHYQHDEIARSIRTLSGVTGLANQITVTPRPNTSKIEKDIEHALHRSWYPSDHIKVSAKGGEVHLTGNADSWYDRNRAAMTAWNAPGTTSVVNDIRIN
jgi:osmotically-inducible protein OsmY